MDHLTAISWYLPSPRYNTPDAPSSLSCMSSMGIIIRKHHINKGHASVHVRRPTPSRHDRSNTVSKVCHYRGWVAGKKRGPE